MGAVGVGAVSGAFALPRFGRKLPADALVVFATLLFAGGMVAMALVSDFWVLVPCLVAIGLAWLTMMATLNASAQTVLPDWIRARGLAVFLIVFSGSMAAGAAAWGLVGDLTSTATALLAAAALAGLGCLLAPFLRLATGELRDLAPTKQMPIHSDPGDDEDTGEVQVLIRYRIASHDEHEFRSIMQRVRHWRLRTGAHAWSIYRDFDTPNEWVESFLVASWVEHLRQHDRTTEDDWSAKNEAYRLHVGDEIPRVVHLIAPRSDGTIPQPTPLIEGDP